MFDGIANLVLAIKSLFVKPKYIGKCTGCGRKCEESDVIRTSIEPGFYVYILGFGEVRDFYNACKSCANPVSPNP